METDIRKKIYIKIYYSLLDWEWYKEPNTFRVFIHLLLTANRKDQPYKGDVIHRGDVLASQEYIADETGLSIQNVKTALKNLLLTGEVTKRKIGKTNVFTVVSYDKWQGGNQISNYEPTTNQPRTNYEVTTNQPQANHDLTTPIYCKNENNDRLTDCDKKIYTHAKTNNNYETKKAPSYDIDEAMRYARLLDPTQTKKR